jgi:oligopeptide/dipeptide ABC transporter ATP-binding protein
MYASRIVEFASVEEVFEKPQHPYTKGLLHSVPKLGAHAARLESIPGSVPNPARFPSGCKFHPRCPRTRELAARQPGGAAAAGQAGSPVVEINADGERVRVMGVCVSNEPGLKEVQPRHWGACHFVDNYDKALVTLPVLDHRRQVTANVVATEHDGKVVAAELGAPT